MDYSPKLKKAMAEIEAIIKREDIAGVVILHHIDVEQFKEENIGKEATGYTELYTMISPSYSCVKKYPQQLRFEIKSAEIGREKAFQQSHATYNMLNHLTTVVCNNALLFMELFDKYKSITNHKSSGPDKFTSREEFGN